MSTPNTLVQKLWSYCNIFRDDGLSYGDYVEQVSSLLFPKMADAQTNPPSMRPHTGQMSSIVPCAVRTLDHIKIP